MGARRLNRRKLTHLGKSYVWHVGDLDYESPLRITSHDKKFRVSYRLPQRSEESIINIYWQQEMANKKVSRSVECVCPLWFPDFSITPKGITQIIDWSIIEIGKNVERVAEPRQKE